MHYTGSPPLNIRPRETQNFETPLPLPRAKDGPEEKIPSARIYIVAICIPERFSHRDKCNARPWFFLRPTLYSKIKWIPARVRTSLNARRAAAAATLAIFYIYIYTPLLCKKKDIFSNRFFWTRISKWYIRFFV